MMFMCNQPLVYVVMPLYNSALYVEKAIASLKCQTYSNWKCVIVDDCSSDDSIFVCKKVTNGDFRFHIVCMGKNSGPAHARNVGISHAKEAGAILVSFLDSDDFYEPFFLQKMVEASAEKDVVWCNYYEYSFESVEKKMVNHGFEPQCDVSAKNMISCFFNGQSGIGSMWNKLYRVSFLVDNNLSLNEERVRAEDWEFNLMVALNEPRVSMIAQPLYNYIHYPRQSVMASYREKDFELFWRSKKMLESACEKYDIPYDCDKRNREFMKNLIGYLFLMKSCSFAYIRKRINFIVSDSRLFDLWKLKIEKTDRFPFVFQVAYILLRSRCYTILSLLIKLR